jgi:hypothetical protein
MKNTLRKILLIALMSSVSFSIFSTEEIKQKKKKKKEVTQAVVVKPCDSKEDIIKKLEKEKEEKSKLDQPAKGFSLQGGDTGCKVK